MVEYEGQTMSLVEACERAGIRSAVVVQRLYKGWSVDRALSTPVASRLAVAE
jgi:hypothetical protein